MSKYCSYIEKVIRARYDSISPCSYIKRRANMFDLEEIKQYNTWLESLNDTEWDPACQHCQLLENKGIISPRLIESDKTYPGLQLQVQIDRECNAACIMCGPENSTTWQKYKRNISGKENSKLNNNQELIDVRIQNILSLTNGKQISLIKFLGGEPLNSNTHIVLLNEIKKITDTKEIILHYSTNGSILPSTEVLNLWKEFSRVQIDMSIDGIGEHFNYIRWPLKWHQVEKNIKFYRDLDSVKLRSFPIVLNPLNIYYYDTYVDWSIKTFGVNKFDEIMDCLGIINLSCVPDKLIDIIKSKYVNTENLRCKRTIIKLLNNFDIVKYKEFIKYIEFHDHHRKLNWRKVFPEVEQYFNISI